MINKMTDRQKKILIAAGVTGASLTLVQLGLLGALGGIGPLKGLQKMRMEKSPETRMNTQPTGRKNLITVLLRV